MPMTPDRLPFPLSNRVRDSIQSISSRQGRQIDYAIAGVPFLSAASKDIPYTVSTADMKKTQVDMSSEPGEHTLTGWWVRAQSSWHQGAGNKYQELTNQYGDAEPSYQFSESEGVYPWTKGELSLYPDDAHKTIGRELWCVKPGNTGFMIGSTGEMGTFIDGTYTELLGGLAEHVTDMLALPLPHAGGTDFHSGYVGVSGTELYLYDADAASDKTFTLTGSNGNDITSVVLYSKFRLWVATGNRLFQIPIADLVAAADGASFDPWWVNPDASWNASCIADSPSSVYVGGLSLGTNTETNPIILKVEMTSDGNVPTANAVTTAVFPFQEHLYSMCSINGDLLGIGTSKGVRVAQVSDSGDLNYGPLCCDEKLVRVNSVATTGNKLYAFGRVSYDDAEYDGTAYAVVTLDLTQQRQDGTFPWCVVRVLPDVSGVSSWFGTMTVDVSGNYLAWGNDQVLHYPGSTYTTGWVNVGYIRFGMQEPKLFKRFGLATEPLLPGGAVKVELLADNGTSNIATFNEPGGAQFQEVSVPSSLGPRTIAAPRLTIVGPAVVRNYWVKALPAVRPQRIWQVPLMCYDRERYRSGQEYGYDGFSADRLLALQTAEDGSDTVLWQDFRTETPTGRQVVIDKLQYVEQVPQGPGVRGSGGIIVASLRTLD